MLFVMNNRVSDLARKGEGKDLNHPDVLKVCLTDCVLFVLVCLYCRLYMHLPQ